MPQLIDPQSRSRLIADAVNDLLVLDGAPGVTMRALADRSGISTSSLLHHLESRERILRVAATLTARAHVAEIDRRHLAERVNAHLPHDQAGLRDVAIWLAWTEYARHADFLQPAVGKWHLEERARLRDSVIDAEVPRSETTESAADAVFAHLCGLRVAMCRSMRPLGIDAARASLRDVALSNRCRRRVA